MTKMIPRGGSGGKLPSVIVVMGVSGSGKSTIGLMLAHRLDWEFADADWFHPAANVDKMHSGVPLTDDDRGPWLEATADWIDGMRRAGKHGIVACSARSRPSSATICSRSLRTAGSAAPR